MRSPRTLALLLALLSIAALVGWNQCSAPPEPAPSAWNENDDESQESRQGVQASETLDRREQSAAATDDSATAAPSDRTATPGSLRVSVRLEDGRPGSPLPVTLTALQGRAESLDRQIAITDQLGEVAFGDLTPGAFEVTLGRAAEERVDVLPGQETALELTIPLGRTVLARVLDSSGSPCANARVLMWAGGSFSDAPSWGPGEEIGLTDARGELLVTGAPNLSHNGSWFAAKHDRFGSSAAEEVPAPEEEADEPADPGQATVELQLGLGGSSIRCQIIDPSGQAVPDALVELRPVDGAGPERIDDGGRRTPVLTKGGRTDELGTVTLAPFPNGTWDLRVRHPKYAFHRERLKLTGQPLQVKVELTEPAVFVVRCVDEHGNPIDGAWVSARVAEQRFRGTSAASGTITFPTLPAGRCDYGAYHDDHAPASGNTTVSLGETTEVEVVLPDLGRIHGTIRDDTGTPLKDWRVTVRGDMPTFGTDMRTTLVEQPGEFSIAVRKDLRYWIEVQGPDEPVPIRMKELGEFSHDASPVALIVRRDLLSSAYVSGRLLDSEGRPALEGVYISTAAHGRIQYTFNTLRVAERDDTTGRFKLGPLRPGEHKLTFHRPDKFEFEAPAIVLAPNSTTELGNVTWPASGTLRITANALPGVDAADIQVQIEQGSSRYFVAIDAETLVGTTALAPGEYKVKVYGGGFYSQDGIARVEAQRTTEHQAILQPSIRVPFRLHVPEGEAGITVRLLDAARRLVFDFEIDARQKFDAWAPQLPPGRYFIEAEGKSGARYMGDFEVKSLEGTPVRRDFYLKKR